MLGSGEKTNHEEDQDLEEHEEPENTLHKTGCHLLQRNCPRGNLSNELLQPSVAKEFNMISNQVESCKRIFEELSGRPYEPQETKSERSSACAQAGRTSVGSRQPRQP